LDAESPVRRVASTLFAAAALFAGGHVLADSPVSDAASAQLFFERGRQAAMRGDAAEACKNFEESLRLDLAVGTLFNLARCEEDLGRFASAWQHLREGIDLLEDKDPRRRQALAAATALEPRVPQLDVQLAPGTEGRVFRDGVELASLSLATPLPVNPGRHAVVVRASGRAEATYDVELREGEHRTLVVAPGPAPSVSADSPKSRSSTLRTTGWITAGAGAASLGAGLVAGALALERSVVVHDHCDDTNTCDGRGLDALASSKELGAIATVTLAAGAALIAAGVVFLLIGKDPTSTATAPSTMLRF
jgi:tetratricopeptide (TPR) repeat protein